jgi:hypothetical protein
VLFSKRATAGALPVLSVMRQFFHAAPFFPDNRIFSHKKCRFLPEAAFLFFRFQPCSV